MNKFIKKISIFLTIVTLLMVLVACGDKNTHQHDYSPKSDDTYHWQECSCGDIQNRQKHTLKIKYDDNNHWQECEECNFITNKTTHNFGEWQIIEEATCTHEGQKKKTCSCGKTIYEPIAKKPHNFIFTYDEDLHWKECSECGEKQGEQVPHVFDSVTHKCECGMYEPSYSSYGLVYELNNDKNAYIVSGYTGTDENVIIAEEYEELPVTTIGTSAFENSTIKTIKFPNNLTTIGDKAFNNCAYISEIILPENVISIGNRAFGTCNLMKTLSIPAGINHVGEHAFIGNKQIEYLTLPASIISDFEFIKGNLKKVIINGGTEIPENAFYDVTTKCPYLKEVVLSNTIISIGKNAFCQSGLEKINIPSSVKNIDANAFKCQYLKEVYVEDIVSWCNINFAPSYANPLYYGDLYINNTLASDITIPTGVNTINDYAFYKCKTIRTVVVTNSTKIGNNSFSYCENLEKIELPTNLKTIGNYAFYNDTKLQQVVLPDNLQEIGNYAFDGCTGFNEVYIPQNIISIGAYAFDNRNLIIKCNNKANRQNWNANWATYKKLEFVAERPIA